MLYYFVRKGNYANDVLFWRQGDHRGTDMLIEDTAPLERPGRKASFFSSFSDSQLCERLAHGVCFLLIYNLKCDFCL